MWNLADRSAKMIADLTVGTVIVLVHVAIADRRVDRTTARVLADDPDGERSWRSNRPHHESD